MTSTENIKVKKKCPEIKVLRVVYWGRWTGFKERMSRRMRLETEISEHK